MCKSIFNCSVSWLSHTRVSTAHEASCVRGVQIEQDPGNFRTMGALQRTQEHLLGIMDSRGVALASIHKFLWDRFRGVRQDLFVQGLEVRCWAHPAIHVQCNNAAFFGNCLIL